MEEIPMKLKLAMLLAAGFLLTLSCGGGKEEIKPAAAEAEVVETAATLLEKGQKESDAGRLNDAVQILNRLLEDFPEGDEVAKAEVLIAEVEKKLDMRRTETEKIQDQESSDLIAALRKVPGEGYDFYYDDAVYEMEGSKVYLSFRWSGSGQANIRFVIDHLYGADKPILTVKSYTMNVDGQPYPLNHRPDQVSMEKQGEFVKEALNTRPSMANRGMIEAIVEADQVVLVVEGENRSDERELTTEEKNGFESVMTAFIAIGGIW
jgi:hypothetical protein